MEDMRTEIIGHLRDLVPSAIFAVIALLLYQLANLTNWEGFVWLGIPFYIAAAVLFLWVHLKRMLFPILKDMWRGIQFIRRKISKKEK